MRGPKSKKAGWTLRLLPLVFAVWPLFALAQDGTLPDAPQPQTPAGISSPQPKPQRARPSPNHIFWIIPNYRSDENPAQVKTLTPRQKFKIGFDDSFDPSAFLVAGVFAGIADATVQYPDFGHGASAFGKYYAGAFADQAIGNLMTESIFPVMLHQDPRYFVKGKGGIWSRTGYAISREVTTRSDDGASQFNTSELAGNAVAAGISNLYYPAASRTIGKTASKWGQQIALDTFFNVMKEFWPDVRDKLFDH